MVHGAHAVEVVERVVYLLTLLAYVGLHEAAVVVFANHGRDVALQLRHLAGGPTGEIAEGHFVALADDVVELVEHTEVDLVYLPHLLFQTLGRHHGVEQHLVGALQGGQHVETFHEVGHAHVVVALGLGLAGFEQCLVQQPGGVLLVEANHVVERGVGVYPDGVFAAFEHTAEDGGQRTGAQLGVGHGQHVGHERRVGHVPVEIARAPLGVEPALVEVARCLGLRYVGMGHDALLKMFPHVDDDATMVPPLSVSLLGLVEILLPSFHILPYVSSFCFACKVKKLFLKH